MVRRIRGHWEAHFLLDEAIASTAVACFVVVWAERLGGGSWLWAGLDAQRGAIYTTAASLGGALLGFVLTTLTIVSGIVSLPSLQRLRSSNQYPTLWAVFKLTLRILALVVAVALFGLIADRDSSPLHWVFYVLVWLVLWGAVLLVRTVWVLERTLAIATAGIAEPNPGSKT